MKNKTILLFIIFLFMGFNMALFGQLPNKIEVTGWNWGLTNPTEGNGNYTLQSGQRNGKGWWKHAETGNYTIEYYDDGENPVSWCILNNAVPRDGYYDPTESTGDEPPYTDDGFTRWDDNGFATVSVVESPVVNYYYRTASSGNWSSTSIWEVSTDQTSWSAASETPNADNSVGITVANDVSVDATVTIDQTSVSSGSTLSVNSGVTLTVDDGDGTDLQSEGSLDIDGTLSIGTATVDANGSFDASGGSVTFTDAGYLYLGGSVTSLGTFTKSTSTVTYDGTDQTVAAVDYYSLALEGDASTKTFADGTTKVDNNIELTDNMTLTGSSSDAVTVQVTTPFDWNGTSGNSSATTSRVCKVNASGKTISISNITIKGGNVYGNTGDNYGGAIYLIAGSLDISNCVFEGSKAYYGGALYASSGTTLNFENSSIISNWGRYGSGVDNYGGSATINNCTFESNYSYSQGAYYSASGTDVINNCTFHGNSASSTSGGSGGALYLGTSNAYILNTTISGNSAKYDGAGIYNANSNIYMVNNIVTHNYRSGYPRSYTDIYSASGIYGNYNISSFTNFGTGTTGNVEYTYTNGQGASLFDSYTTIIADTYYSPVLADNGGSTQTCALASNSIAQSQGVKTGSYNIGGTGYAFSTDGSSWFNIETGNPEYRPITEITTDQRGETRGNPPSIGSYDQLPVYYIAKTAGNWSITSIWYTNTTGGTTPADYTTAATETPTADNSVGIIVNADVTVDASVSVDQTSVTSGSTLSVSTGQTLTVADGDGADLQSEGSLDIDGTLTIGTASVDVNGSFDATDGNVTFTDAGSLNLGGTVTSLGTFTKSTSTVTYDGTDQTVAAVDYYTLALEGDASTKTFADGTTKIDNNIELDVNMTLTGSSFDAVTVQVTDPYNWNGTSGNSSATQSRVFKITTNGITVNVENLTIKGGDISSLGTNEAKGGGIYLFANSTTTLNIESCVIQGSKATHGGGIYNYSSTIGTLTESTIQYCVATERGGGVMSNGIAEITTISKCTFAYNSSLGFGGGGINNQSSTIGSLNNSTIANNSTSGKGGGLFNFQDDAHPNVTIQNCTFSGNSANEGDGIYLDYDLTILNSIIEDEYHCSPIGNLTDEGYNIVKNSNVASNSSDPTYGQRGFNNPTSILYNTKYNDEGTTFTSWTQGGAELSNQDLNLSSTLADNGTQNGTYTLALESGSLAIEAIPYTDAGSGVWNGALTTAGSYYDQRGEETTPSNPISIGAFSESPVVNYYYRTASSGNWSSTSVWEVSTDQTSWSTASETPNADNSDGISVNHDVSVDADVSIDQTTINTDASITVDSEKTLTIANGDGNDLTVAGNGALDVNGSIDASSAQIMYSGSGSLNLVQSTFSVGSFTAGSSTVNFDGTHQSIPGLSYYNLNLASSGTKTAAGNMTIANNLNIASGVTFDANTVDIDIAGNWDNSGTFTSNYSTVTFDGTFASTIDAGTGSFYILIVDKTSNTRSANNVTFQNDDIEIASLQINNGELIQNDVKLTASGISGSAITVGANGSWSNNSDGDVYLGGGVSNSGAITFDGNTASPDGIQIRSSVNGSQRNWQGSGTFNMTDVDVKDQTCSGGTPAYISVNSGNDSGNNINWYFSGDKSISGTIYSDGGSTVISSDADVVLYIKNSDGSSVSLSASVIGGLGTYQFSSLNFSDGDAIIVYINDNPTYEGNTITRSGSSSISNFDIYGGTVIVRSETATAISNTILSNAHNGDSDIKYTVSDGNLDISPGYNLQLWSNSIFTPAGDISVNFANAHIDGTLNMNDKDFFINTMGNLDLNGTLTMTSGSLSVAGNIDFTGGTFNAGSSNVTMNASLPTIDLSSGDNSFNHITFIEGAGGSAKGGGGTVYQIQDDLDVNGNLTITSGTLNTILLENNSINIAGNWSNSGTFTANSATVTFDGTSEQEITSGGSSFYNVSFINVSDDISLQDAFTISGSCDLKPDAVLTSSNDITLSGSTLGSGTVNITGGTFTYNRSGDQSIYAGTYNNMSLGGTGTKTASGAFDASSLSTTNTALNIDIQGDGTSVTDQINFLNTGTVTIGNDPFDEFTFSGGIITKGNASNPSLTNLQGTITTSSANGAIIKLGKLIISDNVTLNPVGNELRIGGSTIGTITISNGKTLTVGTGETGIVYIDGAVDSESGGTGNLTINSNSVIALAENFGSAVPLGTLNLTDGTVQVSSRNINADQLEIDGGTFGINPSGNWDIGDLDISLTATLVGTSASFNLSGNWTNNGTYSHNLGSVLFNGTTASSIEGATDFYNLTINNTGGVSLTDNIYVANNLTLTNGLVVLGDYDLSLAGSVSGTPSASNMVVTDGTGIFKKEFSGPGSFTFPIGENSASSKISNAVYSPATIGFTAGTFASSAWAGVKVTQGKQSEIPGTTNYINRYWSVSQDGISDFSCNTNFQYQSADVEGSESAIYGAKYDGSNWTKYSAVNTINHQIICNDVTSFSDFTGRAFGPTTQASDLVYSSTTCSETSVSWTRGNGDYCAVFMKATSSETAAPVDGTTYTANTTFGDGTQIGSTGWYCIYNGSGTEVAVTGLTDGSTYRVHVCEYIMDEGLQAYNPDDATDNPANEQIYDDFDAGEIETTGETICYSGNPDEIGSSSNASGGDENYTYKWQSSSNAEFTSPMDIEDSDASTYDPPTGLTADTWFRRLAKDGTCNTSFTISSGTWKISVGDEFDAGSIQTTGESICYEGDPVEIGNISSASGGNGSITYKWQYASDEDFTTPIDITNSNAVNYNPPSGADITCWYRRLAKDESCNESFVVSEGTWKLTVYEEFLVGSISEDQMICESGVPEELIGVAPSGGNTPYSYQWQISSNNQDFYDISGATDLNYQPNEISETTFYRLKQTSASSCGEEYTNSVEIHIHSLCCSEESNTCQSPNIGENSAIISDVNYDQKIYDNYSNILGAITDIEWWGSTVGIDDSYCEENPKSFVISFYEDNNGAVGSLIKSFQIEVSGTPAGATLVNDVPIMTYQYHLATPVITPTEGWVSIQGNPAGSCDFTWVTSPNGDGYSIIEGGDQKGSSSEDFAFGLTYSPDIPLDNYGIYLLIFLMAFFVIWKSYKAVA